MASPVLPDSANFLGVALVINRSRDGPRFVFHYPPRILPVGPRPHRGGLSDDLDHEDEMPDQVVQPSLSPPSSLRPKSLERPWDQDDHLETDSGSQIIPWEHVAGYPTQDLGSLLTPARIYHEKLFQVSLDRLCYVSYPIYVPENGVWKWTKKKEKTTQQQHRKRTTRARDESREASSKHGDGRGVAAEAPGIATSDMADEAARANAPAEDAEEKRSGMTMFNLVFILSPRKCDARELINNLYLNIIRKVNKAYKYSQQRSDFIWQESKRILALKDKGREASKSPGFPWWARWKGRGSNGQQAERYGAAWH